MTFRDFKLLVVAFVTQATIKSPPNRYPGPGIAEEAHGVKTWKNPRSAEGETSHKVRTASCALEATKRKSTQKVADMIQYVYCIHLKSW